MKIVFNKAQKEDLAAIVAIYNETIASRMVTADLEPVSVKSRQQWFEEHDESYPFWVMKDADKIAGWIGLEPFYGRPAYAKTAEISIYIAGSYRQQGLGQQALDFVFIQLEALELENLVAFIFGHNQPSLKLFAKNHFEHWGHLPKVALMDGKQRDLEIFGRNF